MDKSWMTIRNRMSKEYQDGVDSFLHFATTNVNSGDSIHCPCMKCMNVDHQTILVVKLHLIRHGIAHSYKT